MNGALLGIALGCLVLVVIGVLAERARRSS